MNEIDYNFNLKDRYDCKCIKCNSDFIVKPSPAMQHRLNTGHGNCPDCKLFLHLYIDQQTNTMISEEWNDYLMRRKDENN
jgi:hypothetical protein